MIFSRKNASIAGHQVWMVSASRAVRDVGVGDHVVEAKQPVLGIVRCDAASSYSCTRSPLLTPVGHLRGTALIVRADE
jgi:hypothetical protein